MSKQIDPNSRTAKCPRCGYDLRGTIETWAEQCPLLGICNECGLEVKWAEVLHPEKFEPLWCVEFVRSRKLLLSSCGKTFLRSFWPFQFWSMLKMSLDIRWGRITLYLAALLLPLLMGYVCIQSAMAIRVRSFYYEQIAESQAQIQSQIADFNANKPIMLQYFKDNYQQRNDELVDLLTRDSLDLATQDMIDETVSWLDDVDEQGLDSWAQQQVQNQLQTLQQFNTPITMSHSDIVVIGEAIFLPFSDTSISGISSTSWGINHIHHHQSLGSLLEIISMNIITMMMMNFTRRLLMLYWEL